jgi:transcriptional regulator with XRE-family HTH domain
MGSMEADDVPIAIKLRPPEADRDAPSPAELLGRAILRLRLYHGWTQRELERRCGVDQTTLSRLERGGRANLGSRRLGAVLGALQVGDVVLRPRAAEPAQTPLELMLYGDRWVRAGREAERRVSRRRSA